MKIYIDSKYRCHTTNPDNIFREVETDFFDGKCDTFIEGYRFVPAGETWVRSDGKVFRGEMVAPWRNYDELDTAQREYERQLIEELQENSIPTSELELAYQEGVNNTYA